MLPPDLTKLSIQKFSLSFWKISLTIYIDWASKPLPIGSIFPSAPSKKYRISKISKSAFSQRRVQRGFWTIHQYQFLNYPLDIHSIGKFDPCQGLCRQLNTPQVRNYFSTWFYTYFQYELVQVGHYLLFWHGAVIGNALLVEQVIYFLFSIRANQSMWKRVNRSA